MVNRIQKNFKRQINASLKKLERDAKKGKCPLSNNLYRLKYYGYNSVEEPKNNIFIRLIKFIFRLVTTIIMFFIFSIVFLFVTVSIINFIKKYIMCKRQTQPHIEL